MLILVILNGIDAWAGPIKQSRKDGCYSNSAGQGSVGRKKREDLMTEEGDPDRKRQRTELVMLGIHCFSFIKSPLVHRMLIS